MKRKFLFLVLLAGCSSDIKLDIPPETKPLTIGISTDAYKPSYESYTYKGTKYPDPFLPSSGGGYFSGEYTFEPNTAQLVGIIKTRDGTIAVLSIAPGVSFILKNGRLYDPKKKEVSGYVGIIEGKTVKIVDENRTEYVYSLR